jgi:glycosyltransferase involved in cell wall biosynthesis
MGHLYNKSLFLLLEGYERARKKVPGLNLVFLGKMMLPEGFEKRLEPYLQRNSGMILRLGEKPPKDVPAYLAAADALLLPMEDHPIEQARFPIRFGDYLMSGTPIVSNAVGEVARFMAEHDCGYAAKVDDATDFGDKLVQALTDPARRAVVQEKAETLIRTTLNWDVVAEKLEKIYAKAMA